MRRSLGFLVFLLLTGGAVWIGLVWGSNDAATVEALVISRQMESAPEVSVDVPPGWNLQRFGNDLSFVGHVGFIASNLDHTFRYPDLGPNEATSAWDMRGLPDDLIAVEVSRVIRFPMKCHETSEFPPSMENGEWSQSDYGSPPGFFIPACVKRNLPFGVHVWIGDDATDEDVTDLQRLLASIKPLG